MSSMVSQLKSEAQAVLGRQHIRTTPWLTERHGYDPTFQGLEDFYGDMDFKVAGTHKGITSIQMDLKIKSEAKRS